MHLEQNLIGKPRSRNEHHKTTLGDYYVYVYIDPRNFEEFYYGKGKDRRKSAHLLDVSSSEKAKRINEIHQEGLEPIIRIIARGLTEHEAFLVEKTLLWKLGKNLLNDSAGSGGFAEKFRPHNKMHINLSGFDYVTGLYYFNIGDGEHRRWSDCRRLGFISAGQGVRWKDAICGFREGDIIAAYLKRHGFVGIGFIKSCAKPISEVTIKGRPLLSYDLDCQRMDDHIENRDFCEYVALVEWVGNVDANKAVWRTGLYTTPLVRASLDNQPATVEYVGTQFGIDLNSLRKLRSQISD